MRILADRWGFTLVIGPWAGKFSFNRVDGRFANGSRYFSGWHRWREDADA